jgi:hypothetical protein
LYLGNTGAWVHKKQNINIFSWMWWRTPATSALERLTKENHGDYKFLKDRRV